MSVSSPSEFSPAASNGAIVGAISGPETGARVFLAGKFAGRSSTVADIIVVGDSSGGASSGAGFTDAGLRGSVVLGSTSLPVNVDATTDVLAGGGVGAVLVIGWNNFPAVVAGSRLAGTIAIGANIATSFPAAGGSSNFARNLFIGNSVWNNNTAGNGFGSSDNIIVGYAAGTRGGAAGNSQWLHNTVIGSQAGIFSGSSLADNVIIGYQACNAMANTPSQNVVIGAAAGQSLTNTSNNTLVGYGTNLQAPVNGQNVLVGAQSSLLNGDRNTCVGALQTWCGNGSSNIGLGSRNTGSTIPANPSNRVVIEADGNTFVYGNMLGGNFVIGGQPSTAAQRTIPDVPNGATNTLGLVNGTASGTAPVNGGYFYVAAGALHWRGPVTDTVVAPA